jgi:hypothetical protein
LAHWGDWEHADGTVCHKINSYRSLRYEWQGFPTDAPAIFAFAPDCQARVASYMSWNGATEVATWEVWGADSPRGLFQHISSTNRSGFESRVSSEFANYVYALALDDQGNELGRSAPTRVAVSNVSKQGEPTGMACSDERCEPGIDYATHASLECPPTKGGPSRPDASPIEPGLQEQERGSSQIPWMHCDPCFGPFQELWQKFLGGKRTRP